MNHIQNDYGQWVEAIGAPASIERVKVEFPKLIERINSLYWQSFDAPGCAVDEAIRMIRDIGINSQLETRSILMASDYSLEPPGSVTRLVLQIEHAPQRPLSSDGGESTAQSSAVACPDDDYWADQRIAACPTDKEK